MKSFPRGSFWFLVVASSISTAAGMIWTKIEVIDLNSVFEIGRLLPPLVLYLTGIVAFLFLLARYRLSIAFPIVNALSMSCVVLGGVVILKEQLSVLTVLGLLAILCGIFLMRPSRELR